MKQVAVIVLGCSLLVSASYSQTPGGPPPDPCAALAKFLTRDTAFTATAHVVSTGKKARNNQSMVMDFAVDGGNMRNEMDMTKMSGVRASDVDGMKQMGMDKMVILKQAAKHAAYIVYPNLQSYCDMPPGKPVDPDGKLEKTELGDDTVDKHPCKKSKLTFTDKEGRSAEALVWEATDMKNFPIQYQTVDEGQTTTTTFSDIKMGKPDASLFELPASYKKYGSMQEMMMGNMQRMMQQMK
jgi:outer membrane lipoprotein-sorting protein